MGKHANDSLDGTLSAASAPEKNTHTQKNGTICFEHYLFKGSLRAVGGSCWHCVGLVALRAHTLCVSAGYTDGLVAKTR